MNLNKFLNKKVLVRTQSSGVHFGTLLEQESTVSGSALRLGNARRLWSWNGALSLHEVASKGVDIKNSKISEQIEEIILPSHIELLPLTSNLSSL
jgi:hypothetical protein